MIIAILFWMLTLVGCAYAAGAGEREGRWAASLIVAASLLTIPASLLGRAWRQPELGILVVDLGLLAGLYALTLASRRHFPIWMTGFHLVAVVTHASAAIAPEFTPKVYRALAGMWAVPITISMVVGILLDQRMSLGAERNRRWGRKAAKASKPRERRRSPADI